jgi:hypothetical protein
MNPKVFLRFIELKLLSQDTLSKQGLSSHIQGGSNMTGTDFFLKP